MTHRVKKKWSCCFRLLCTYIFFFHKNIQAHFIKYRNKLFPFSKEINIHKFLTQTFGLCHPYMYVCMLAYIFSMEWKLKKTYINIEWLQPNLKLYTIIKPWPHDVYIHCSSLFWEGFGTWSNSLGKFYSVSLTRALLQNFGLYTFVHRCDIGLVVFFSMQV